MKFLSKYNNQLKKADGTNQFQRSIPSLDPDYIKVDERTLKDLLDFTYRISQQVKFYDLENLENGNWRLFFSNFIEQYKTNSEIERALKEKKDLQPHIALFLSFIKLYQVLQSDINQLTQKHLDYYYQRILGFNRLPPRPDVVEVVFELTKNLKKLQLPKGTRLDGGKDKKGNKLTYETDQQIIINQGKVDQLKSLLIDQINNNSINYYALQANSKDGFGTPFEEENFSWSAFGESQQGKETASRTMREAKMGFVIASPQLILKEGKRTIILTLELDSLTDNLPKFNLNNAINVYLSTSDGWTQVEKTWIHISEDTIKKELIDDGSGNLSIKVSTTKTRILTAGSISGESIGVDPGPPQTITTFSEWIIKDTYKLTQTIIEGVPTSDAEPPIPAIEKKKVISIITVVEDDWSELTPVSPENNIHDVESSWPGIKILLKHQGNIYHDLKSFSVDSATLDVEVNGKKELLLQNDQFPLDPAKPFLPFGVRPELDSRFFIGSEEVFQKKLSHLQFMIKWKDAPENFSQHYQNSYTTETPSEVIIYGNVNASSFTAKFEYLYKNSWLSGFISPLTLFEDNNSDFVLNVEIDKKSITAATKDAGYERLTDLQNLERFNTQTQNGFVRLTLLGADADDIEITAFGHKQYPKILTRQMVALSNFQGTEGFEPPIPNEPYTPTIEELSLNYASLQELSFNEKGPDQFFTIGPFGFQYPGADESLRLVPNFEDVGYFFIGLQDFEAPGVINLLFKVAEGSASPEKIVEENDISWSYLSDNQWVDFKSDEVISDSTQALLSTGIISFGIPSKASLKHTRMPEGLHWIRGALNGDPDGVNKLIDIKAQAIAATLALPGEIEEQEKLSEHLTLGLKENSIKKFGTPQPAIKAIKQPYRSRLGRPLEKTDLFYSRVSERLRHKSRALTTWDYERLVLEEFPSIFKVKCLNHTKKGSITAPGHLSLIIISNIRNQNVSNPLEPKTSLVTLRKIKEFLLPFTSPHIQNNPVRLSVENPSFERLFLDFKVAFHRGLDVGFYIKQLNEDIKKFLSPWAFEEGKDIVLGGRVYRTDLLAFVESRKYVDYVNDFRLYHIYGEDPVGDRIDGISDLTIGDDFEVGLQFDRDNGIGLVTINKDLVVGRTMDVVEAKSPRSILVSDFEHRILPIEDDPMCQGITSIGIGQMIIGINFEVDSNL
jgi:hypothetical protein